MRHLQADALVGIAVEPKAAATATAQKSLLRFLTCGSVDDGKSTLIGRLLSDTRQIFEDQFAALQRDSKRHGTTGEEVDFALLVDGLEAEREQGITIDVAYRFFSTPHRKFIVADTPGHEQYTRNMATGASTADLAIVLIDARQGVLKQTRRHSIIASLLGIRHIVLAINKIDLVGFDAGVFEQHRRGLFDLREEPWLCLGDAGAAVGTLWRQCFEPLRQYALVSGPTLLEHLETVDVDGTPRSGRSAFRCSTSNRPNLDFRGFAAPSLRAQWRQATRSSSPSPVKSHACAASSPPAVIFRAPSRAQAVTLLLDDEVEVSRGNMLVAPAARPDVADQFAATLVWFDEQALLPGRSYIVRTATISRAATITDLKHRLDINSLAHQPAKSLAMNEVGEGEDRACRRRLPSTLRCRTAPPAPSS